MAIETYVLTLDGDAILKQKGIEGVDAKKYEFQIGKLVSDVLPNTRVDMIPLSHLKAGIAQKVSALKSTNPEKVIISLDDLYFNRADSDFNLEVTRLNDPKDGAIPYKEGPRPWCKPINEQIAEFSKGFNKPSKYYPIDIILVDVGAFGGDTLVNRIVDLAKKGFRTTDVVLGLTTDKATEKLENAGIAQHFVRAYTAKDYEWIEARDLTGLDGRKVGYVRGEGQPRPLEIAGIPKVYMPYAAGQIEDWASLDIDEQDKAKKQNRLISEVKEPLLDIAIQFAEKIDDKAGRKVTIGEFGLPIPLGVYTCEELAQMKIDPDNSFSGKLREMRMDLTRSRINPTL